MPPWFRIVSEYPDFHNGPTIPFLIGALQQPIGTRFANKASARAALRALLETIADEATEEHGVRLFSCPTIKEYVLTDNGLWDSFSWEPINGCAPPNLDCLFEILWTRYGEPIVEGTYSLDDRVWREFTEEEKKTIAEVLGAD